MTVSIEAIDHVCVVEFSRPPHNYFDAALIGAVADACAEASARPECRAVVLASSGRHFCAGADFAGPDGDSFDTATLYAAGLPLFEIDVPLVAAVQGSAIGGGFGLALAADFRVAGPSTRFRCNFARLGIHHGFGLTVTLPRVVGDQLALDLLCTGRTVDGEEALRIRLCDRLAPEGEVRQEAVALAAALAANGPIAVQAIRRTMRAGLRDAVRDATAREHSAQQLCRTTSDFAEGVHAASERREPRFLGR
ncbi:enoyl-CoA hydratase/isomerase family protein [Sporichthya brevicatena]|uniref:Enoyl-CoA hydratase/isomerase family protein n=1 Tax=Sporichthya brevicatena TaxID=171442 RepID=A0ABN1HB52_9ACTN